MPKLAQDDSLDLYLREISHIPLISPAEEIELAKRIKQGDQKALGQLIKANLRFVVRVARHYQNQGLSLADLVNEGNIGLIKAAKRFDETRGRKFITYAVWWIRQSILQALAEHSRAFRLPLNRVAHVQRVSKQHGHLTQQLGYEPRPADIAKALKMSEADVILALQLLSHYCSLDEPLHTEGSGETISLLDILEDSRQSRPDAPLLPVELRRAIEIALSVLTPREAKVIRLYFGLDDEGPLTLEEIGSKFDLTRERIRQIKDKALRRLRHPSRARVLRRHLT